MNAMRTATPEGPAATPIDGFSQCHTGILSGLVAFEDLPAVAQAAQRAQAVAKHTLQLLDHAVAEHHAEEERDLFPAVLRSARKGDEHDRVHMLVEFLTKEHREVEALWK